MQCSCNCHPKDHNRSGHFCRGALCVILGGILHLSQALRYSLALLRDDVKIAAPFQLYYFNGKDSFLCPSRPCCRRFGIVNPSWRALADRVQVLHDDVTITLDTCPHGRDSSHASLPYPYLAAIALSPFHHGLKDLSIRRPNMGIGRKLRWVS